MNEIEDGRCDVFGPPVATRVARIVVDLDPSERRCARVGRAHWWLYRFDKSSVRLRIATIFPETIARYRAMLVSAVEDPACDAERDPVVLMFRDVFFAEQLFEIVRRGGYDVDLVDEAEDADTAGDGRSA